MNVPWCGWVEGWQSLQVVDYKAPRTSENGLKIRVSVVRFRPWPPLTHWSVPETWVTDYSGDIGNTFTSKGFGAHSTRMLSSSKNPRSYCIKLTSQTCSATCLMPTF